MTSVTYVPDTMNISATINLGEINMTSVTYVPDTMNISATDAWAVSSLYEKLYEFSIKNPFDFWLLQSKNIFWKLQPAMAYDGKAWLPGGVSNIYYNCVARHAISTPDKIAFINYFDNPDERKTITYRELDTLVKKIVRFLRYKGIRKGDCIAIFMPVQIQSIAAMLACACIGALHMVVFSGFSADVLAQRVKHCGAKLLLSVPAIERGGKTISLSKSINDAKFPLGNEMPEFAYINDIPDIKNVSDELEWLNNEDEAFILYTSGTSGKFKGVVHAALPYMLYFSSTFKTIFDPRSDDVYFCTSDIGWITGHSYLVYAPLFYGLTSVIFDGTPLYPTPDRYWSIIEREKVNIFYTAPTALRTLRACGDNFVEKYNLSSLRILGSVGEPMNDTAWQWYFDVIGQKRCPIIDTWWQTETGGIVLAPLRNINQHPCVAGKPFFGIDTSIVNGQLLINNKWPGKYKRIIGEDNNNSNAVYCTGDSAEMIGNEIKITGRIDDIINISGHRMCTTEFEKALSTIPEIIESAVVAVPHEITGQTAVVFVVLTQEQYEDIDKKIYNCIRQAIGAIAKPGKIIHLKQMPKTTTGKIERHKLREIALNSSM